MESCFERRKFPNMTKSMKLTLQNPTREIYDRCKYHADLTRNLIFGWPNPRRVRREFEERSDSER